MDGLGGGMCFVYVFGPLPGCSHASVLQAALSFSVFLSISDKRNKMSMSILMIKLISNPHFNCQVQTQPQSEKVVTELNLHQRGCFYLCLFSSFVNRITQNVWMAFVEVCVLLSALILQLLSC